MTSISCIVGAGALGVGGWGLILQQPYPAGLVAYLSLRVDVEQIKCQGERERCDSWRFSPTGANGCPALAVYRATGSGGPSRVFGIQSVTLTAGTSDELIAEVTTFLDPWLVTSFGFPHELTQQTVSHC